MHPNAACSSSLPSCPAASAFACRLRTAIFQRTLLPTALVDAGSMGEVLIGKGRKSAGGTAPSSRRKQLWSQKFFYSAPEIGGLLTMTRVKTQERERLSLRQNALPTYATYE